jgi:mannosyl-3-phosphoglycerate phosphatase
VSASDPLIIFTDLDGSFLDHVTYSFAESLPALKAAAARSVPVVFCSSKTRPEVEVIRQQTGIEDPFVVENGGAIYVPRGYFPFTIEESIRRDAFDVVQLGTPYSVLVDVLRRIRDEIGGTLVGFSDMTREEIAADCGLPLAEAGRAKDREYDEPFTCADVDPEELVRKIEWAGLHCSVGGRYYHIHGENDKGRAVRILNGLFAKACGTIFTVGLGDSMNDLPMLESVDLPVLLQKPGGRYDRTVVRRLPGVRLAGGIGPSGWRVAVQQILAETSS